MRSGGGGHVPIQLLRLAWSVLRARLCRWGLTGPGRPINVTFSVTTRCQSRCLTCRIWEHDPLPELDLDEIDALFRSIGWTYFFNISGGEPYLREDLPEIVERACEVLDPAVIHIPTNALAPERIGRITADCLDRMDAAGSGAILTVKPSFDGVGELHDRIRGIDGNFERLKQTMEILLAMARERSNLQVGVGTVVSRYNIDSLEEIIAYASESWKVDTYINEIAEERSEFHNLGAGITPSSDDYARVMRVFRRALSRRIPGMALLPRITTAMRLVYYDLAARIVREKRQVIPCYAGILNVHINSDGAIWPCAVLGYGARAGVVGGSISFRKVWRSRQMRRIRGSIRRGECYCPLANQAYSNILMSPASLVRALWIALTRRAPEG